MYNRITSDFSMTCTEIGKMVPIIIKLFVERYLYMFIDPGAFFTVDYLQIIPVMDLSGRSVGDLSVNVSDGDSDTLLQ